MRAGSSTVNAGAVTLVTVKSAYGDSAAVSEALPVLFDELRSLCEPV